MTGEMSKADLTEDGEWGLYVKTAKILDCEIKPFDVYQGPYLLYKHHKLWFSNSQTAEWDHGIYDDDTDKFHSLSSEFGDYGFQFITPEQLAEFIKRNIK